MTCSLRDENKFSKNLKLRKVKTLTTSSVICTNYQGNHFIKNCESFLKLNGNERNERVNKLQLCLNCLKKVISCQIVNRPISKFAKENIELLSIYNLQNKKNVN